MVPADFKGGALYISGGQVTNRLNIRGAVTREEVGNVLQGTVDVVEEVVRPGESGLAKPETLLSAHAPIRCSRLWSGGHPPSPVRGCGVHSVQKAWLPGGRWPEVQMGLWASLFLPL